MARFSFKECPRTDTCRRLVWGNQQVHIHTDAEARELRDLLLQHFPPEGFSWKGDLNEQRALNQERRERIAAAALPKITLDRRDVRADDDEKLREVFAIAAKVAVMSADALIAELDKES